MKTLLLAIALLGTCALGAQHTLLLTVKQAANRQPLVGATVTLAPGQQAAVADTNGLATLAKLPAGVFTLTVSFTGMKTQQLNITIPRADSQPLEVLLEADAATGEEGEEAGEEAEEDEEEVVVTATRISRTILNTPTRTEVISGEELAEKGNMKPGDIRMLLNESTGIQTQQTSATSFNAGIRIQGLEGRYTQMLRDGYPLFSGFAGSLSILQIAPLDLQQVEVIKGAASTLYGGGAIAGLVNLVSKTPGKDRELNFLANGTSAGGLDLSGFYSQRYGKAGLTLFASRNSNQPFDPAGNGITAIPRFERYTVNPRLFWYGQNTTADVGISYITEDRTGGSMAHIKEGANEFFETNNTDRITAQLGVTHRFTENSSLQLKSSYSHFDRVLRIPGYVFDALQQSSFTELSWNRHGAVTDWVMGANVMTENLQEKGQTPDPKRDYHYNTFGLFVQNVWPVSGRVVLESGLRADYVNAYGLAVLPRVSAMFRLSPHLTTRIGGGYGYKPPTIFTEEAERRYFKHLQPINISQSVFERSAGGNWDINYRTRFGRLGFSINQLFFYTRLRHPLVLDSLGGGNIALRNANGYLDTKGMETNLRLTYGAFKLFVGYTYTDANTRYDDQKAPLPLTARHRLNNVLMYEIEEKWKLGLEAYYFSSQVLTDGSEGRPYWIAGFMAEKIWERWSLFVNFENMTDTRQSKFGPIFTGPLTNPVFADIYAPVEGFVVNGGLKLRL